MNKELKNKQVTWAAIMLMYAWTFEKKYPDDLAFIDALSAVRDRLTDHELDQISDKANAIVSQGRGAYEDEFNRAAQ